MRLRKAARFACIAAMILFVAMSIILAVGQNQRGVAIACFAFWIVYVAEARTRAIGVLPQAKAKGGGR